MQVTRTFAGLSAGLTALILAGMARAQDAADPLIANIPTDLPLIGRPVDGLMGFQPAGTDHAADVFWLDGMLLWIISAITIFVMVLLLICIVRYNRRVNPTPATFTHNSPLEVTWTVVPLFILIFIGAFSLPILFQDQRIPEADLHIRVTGHQWYWNYEYTDQGFDFDSIMIGQGENVPSEDTLAELAEQGYGPDEFRLATDTAVIVPVGATVVMSVTGGDVIHSWTIPAFGVKQDAVPGRIAQLWFRPEQEGVYFGQCSELCGKDHAYMPITVKVVSQEVYDAWIAANAPAAEDTSS
jgi:cytochrome c oxidase subunit II